jgi:hypothetical protein
VRKTKINYLDFEIDRITRSIENVVTGDSFPTDVSHLVNGALRKYQRKMVGFLIGKVNSMLLVGKFINWQFKAIQMLFRD